MSQVPDIEISNAAAAAVRADINAVLEALATCHCGTSEPATTYPRMLWVDESNGLLKLRNSSNTAWVTLPLNPDSSMTLPAGSTVDGNLLLDAGSLLLGISATGYMVDARTADAGDRLTILPRSGGIQHLAKALTLWRDSGHVEMGTPSASEPDSYLRVPGTIEAASGGFKFPDGTVQASANRARVWHASTQAAHIYTNASTWQGLSSLQITLTPASATAAFRLVASVSGYCDGRAYWRIARGGAGVDVAADGTNIVGAHGTLDSAGGDPAPMVRESVTVLDLPATTSPVTYSLEFLVNSASQALHLNRSKPYSLDTAYSVTTLTVEEIPGGIE